MVSLDGVAEGLGSNLGSGLLDASPGASDLHFRPFGFLICKVEIILMGTS